METVQLTSKCRMMDTLEKFYIFRQTKLNNQINDKVTVKSNVIFDTIIRSDNHSMLPNTYNTWPVDIQLSSLKTVPKATATIERKPHHIFSLR